MFLIWYGGSSKLSEVPLEARKMRISNCGVVRFVLVTGGICYEAPSVPGPRDQNAHMGEVTSGFYEATG